MRKILLIEDSEECHLVVEQAFSGRGFVVVRAATLAEGVQLLEKSAPFDAILLDIILPDGDGLSLLNRMQSSFIENETPVYLLTGKNEIASKVMAFNLGADDYLVKPINPIELRARVEMRLRKTSILKQRSEWIHAGKLRLHTSLMKASIRTEGQQESLELTAKEFKILSYLIQHSGQVFSRSELVRAIWGENIHVLDRTVDSHICGLRKKLKSAAHYVECIPGAGYRFRVLPEGTGPLGSEPVSSQRQSINEPLKM